MTDDVCVIEKLKVASVWTFHAETNQRQRIELSERAANE